MDNLLYTENILQYFKMDEAKSVKTPVNSSQKLMKASDDSVCVDKELYQCAVPLGHIQTFHSQFPVLQDILQNQLKIKCGYYQIWSALQ